MAPPNAEVHRAASPRHNTFFDAWNSSSTGHQRAESKSSGPPGWRQLRSTKLTNQFRGDETGDKITTDQAGPRSEDWDEKAKALIEENMQHWPKVNVQDMVLLKKPVYQSGSKHDLHAEKASQEAKDNEIIPRKKGIFDGLVIYINGTTHPVVSDHKLKYLLAENGAKISLHLGRRQVTHVILGRPGGTENNIGMARSIPGAGGGLAASKIQKDIKRVGGCGIKYVGVEWVMESLKNGKRLSETSFSNLKIAPRGQQSVYTMFKKT